MHLFFQKRVLSQKRVPYHTLAGALALATLAGLAAALPARAQIVTIGTYHGGNVIPFGDYGIAYPNEYQQLYNPAAFTAPLTITSVGFALDNSHTTPGPASFNATISLGTAATLYNAPSTTFADNEGADFTQVFSGTVSTTLVGNGTFDLVFPTSAFTYDPANGPLLLDVVLTSAPTVPASPEYFEYDDSGTDFNRVYTYEGLTATDSAGLVTQFNGAPVPEASTTASFGLLLGLGMGGLVIAARRKKADRFQA